MASFDFVFVSFQKSLILLIFSLQNEVFEFWLDIPSQNSETLDKKQTIVSMVTKVVSGGSIFDKLSEKTLIELILRKVTGFLPGGTLCPPPSGFWSTESLLWLGQQKLFKFQVACTLPATPVVAQIEVITDMHYSIQIGVGLHGKLYKCQASTLSRQYLPKQIPDCQHT